MNQFDLIELGAKVFTFFVPFLFALCFHELAHGLVAKWKGDNTAQMAGRLTMNPMAHADPLGTWILPIASIALGSPFFFGWAKPVPVNERNLRRPKKDMFWVAVAGPLSNLFLAAIGTVVLALVFAHFQNGSDGKAYISLLQNFLLINLFLAAFNLIPIHPLDGGKVIEPFLPYSWNRWLELNQGSLNMGLLLFLLLAGRVLSVPIFAAFNQLQHVAILIATAIS